MKTGQFFIRTAEDWTAVKDFLLDAIVETGPVQYSITEEEAFDKVANNTLTAEELETIMKNTAIVFHLPSGLAITAVLTNEAGKPHFSISGFDITKKQFVLVPDDIAYDAAQNILVDDYIETHEGVMSHVRHFRGN